MKVALVQPCANNVPSIDGAVDRLKNVLADCKDKGVDVAVFPELYLSGYHLPSGSDSFISLGQKIEGPTISKIIEYARLFSVSIVLSFPETTEDTDTNQVYNTVIFIDHNGTILSHHRKVLLWADKERKLFKAGSKKLPVFEYTSKSNEVWNCSLGICYEIEFPEPARDAALSGAQILFIPTANTAERIHKLFVPTRSGENGIYVVYNNWINGPTGFCGLSTVATPDSEIPLQLASKNEGQKESILIGITEVNHMKPRDDFIGDLKKFPLYYNP